MRTLYIHNRVCSSYKVTETYKEKLVVCNKWETREFQFKLKVGCPIIMLTKNRRRNTRTQIKQPDLVKKYKKYDEDSEEEVEEDSEEEVGEDKGEETIHVIIPMAMPIYSETEPKCAYGYSLPEGAKMEEFEGSRAGTKVYMCPNKFMYRMDRGAHGDDVLYYKCSNTRCLGRAISYYGVLSYRSKHCHGPLIAQAEALRFRAELRKRAAVETGSLEMIYMQTQVSYREAAVQSGCGFEQVRPTMLRARNAGRPPAPCTLINAALSIQDPKYFEQYAFSLGPGKRNLYHGMVVDANEKRAMILKSADVIDFIQMHTQEDNSLHLYVDSSYPIKILSGGCSHIMTINLEYRNNGFPLLFAFLEEKNFDMHVSVLTEFKRIIGSVTISSISVAHDDELKTAVKHVLPNVDINNSWFYYSTAIYKQAELLHILEDKADKELRQLIKMAMCLPLLPSDMYVSGGWIMLWNLLNRNIDGIRNMVKLQTFTLYMEAEWLSHDIFQYKRISEYSDTSFKKSLLRLIGKDHISFWTLYKHIQLLEHSFGLKLIRVFNDRDHFLSPKKGFEEFQNHLDRAVVKLLEDNDIEQFLKRMASKLMYVMWLINKYTDNKKNSDDKDSDTDNDLTEATDPSAHKRARRKMMASKGIARKKIATLLSCSMDHNYMKPSV